MSDKILEVIKLITGEELISEIQFDEGSGDFQLKNPLSVHIDEDGRLLMKKWMAFAAKPEFLVEAIHIVASATPDEHLVVDYNKACDQYFKETYDDDYDG